MTREILFRGKTPDDERRWVYGSLIITKAMSLIAVKEMMTDTGTIDDLLYGIIEIDPATVGQFTGLHDKNGVKIFEGDVIETKGFIWLVEPINSEEKDGNKFGLCVSPGGNGKNYFIDKSILKGGIIGNIFDNPELLK